MEKPKTLAEARKEKFERQARIARDLADLALQEIDDVIAAGQHTGFINYEHVIGHSLLRQEISIEEAYEALSAYENWILAGNSGLTAITDSDTLASPLGFAGTESVLD